MEQPGIHRPGPKWINSKGRDLPFPLLRSVGILLCGVALGRLTALGNIDYVTAAILAAVLALCVIINDQGAR